MGSFLFGVFASFLFFVSSYVHASGSENDCVCERNYVGFSIISVFDGVEFFYVASGETMHEAGMRALRLVSLNISGETKILILPFSVLLDDVHHLLINIDPNTGIPNPSIKTSEDGYSAWIKRCVCRQEKIKPKKKRLYRKLPILDVQFPG